MKLKNGTSVALVPMGTGGYSFRDPTTGKRIRITKANAGRFHTEAVLYYRALPARRIDSDDIRQFALRSVSASELILLLSATLAAVLLGMVTPAMTALLFFQYNSHRRYTYSFRGIRDFGHRNSRHVSGHQHEAAAPCKDQYKSGHPSAGCLHDACAYLTCGDNKRIVCR